MAALVMMLHHEPHRIFEPLKDFDLVNRTGIWRNGMPGAVKGNALIAGNFSFGQWRLIYNQDEMGFDEYNSCK